MKTIDDALKIIGAFVVCLAITCRIAHGQQSLTGPPKHAIKFSPLHIANPETASIQLAYEHRFTKRFSVQLEGGYVYGIVWWSYPSEESHGFKLKEDVRWYFYHKEVTKRTDKKRIGKSMYVAVEFHQNRIDFGTDVHTPYRQTRQGFKAGYIRYSAWGFLFDMNVGLSFARTNTEPLGIPLNNYQEGPGGYKAVLPIIGFRLGYWLK